MNELDFQKHLVDEANDIGGHALKANNRFLVGVADLSIKLKEYKHAYVECKKHNTLKGEQKSGLTPHQRNFLVKYREAGGLSGWVTFAPVKAKRDDYTIFVSTDISVRIDFDHHSDYFWYKKRGEPWPIEWIIKTIAADHSPHKSYTTS